MYQLYSFKSEFTVKKFNPNSDFQVSCSSIADGHSLDESFNANEIDIMPGERYGIMLHATMPYTGFISIDYKSMNTDSIWQTENVPLNIIPIEVEETNSELSFAIFPNPVQDVISWPSEFHPALLRIHNCCGQLVREEQPMRTSSSYNLETLTSGSHSLSFYNAKGETLSTQLFIKQ